jgi:hypothetical protein
MTSQKMSPTQGLAGKLLSAASARANLANTAPMTLFDQELPEKTNLSGNAFMSLSLQLAKC